MHKPALSVLTLVFAAACGGSLPPPDQRLTEAEAAVRSASELGAESDPGAALSLKLATEQITMAKSAITREDNARADALLIRAKADAELAIAQTREKVARASKQEAIRDSADQRATNSTEGAAQ